MVRSSNLMTKEFLIILTLFFLVLFLSGFSLFFGEARVSVKDFINDFPFYNDYINNVLYEIRLPRVLASIIVGAGAALSGLLLQIIIKNPLASPSTLGINNASVFGANLALVVLPTLGARFYYLTSFSSFVFAIITQCVFLYIIRCKSHKSFIVILLGVAISSIYHAGTMLVQTYAEDNTLASAVFWAFGDLGRINYNEILIILGILIFSFLFLIRYLWDLNCLYLGDVDAISLGVNVKNIYTICIIISCLNTSVVVSFVGIIGFIGLMSPQISRILVSVKLQYYLPVTCLIGSNVLLLADILARGLTSTSIPVGIITSFFGAPIIIYLLIKEVD
ncbi:TPA: FecCD family ABC transporter permease [Salmonella enterica subsp. enterica serovar Muenchen]|nr:iron ABC transporter permease [Salmonella enterica]EIP3426401.1 iron ABC transporter permease [Salmonella enterica]HAO3760635.1 iron ABC transporter permease [Salmonella enterica]